VDKALPLTKIYNSTNFISKRV